MFLEEKFVVFFQCVLKNKYGILFLIKHAKMIAMRKVTLSFLYFFCKEQAEEKG